MWYQCVVRYYKGKESMLVMVMRLTSRANAQLWRAPVGIQKSAAAVCRALHLARSEGRGVAKFASVERTDLNVRPACQHVIQQQKSNQSPMFQRIKKGLLYLREQPQKRAPAWKSFTHAQRNRATPPSRAGE
jgi:hypothetical protein